MCRLPRQRFLSDTALFVLGITASLNDVVLVTVYRVFWSYSYTWFGMYRLVTLWGECSSQTWSYTCTVKHPIPRTAPQITHVTLACPKTYQTVFYSVPERTNFLATQFL